MEPSQKSSKKSISKFLLDSTVVLAVITIVSYIMAYVYEAGRASYFFIPYRLISVGSVYTGLFMTFVFFFALYFCSVYEFLSRSIPRKLILLLYPAYVGYCLFMIPAPQSAYDFVIKILFFCACFVIFYSFYSTIINKVEIEKFFQKTQIIPASYMSYVYPLCVLLVVFFAFLLALFSFGRMQIHGTRTWYIVGKPNHVMVNVYDENVVCISIDPNNNRFENEIIVYKTSQEKPLHLNYKRIGRIRPKKGILHQLP